MRENSGNGGYSKNISDSDDSEYEDDLKPQNTPRISSRQNSVSSAKSGDSSDNISDNISDSFQNYGLPTKRHSCLLSEMSGMAEGCRPGYPAELTPEKIKSHYMVHYMQRGVWDHLIAIPSLTDKKKIEAYECKPCKKKFRNKPEMDEFPARGTLLCHAATHHGKLWEAMRDDDYDVFDAIQAIRSVDKQFNQDALRGVLPVYNNESIHTKFVYEYKKKPENSDNLVMDAPEVNNEETAKVAPEVPEVPQSTEREGHAAITQELTMKRCPLCDFKNPGGETRPLRFHIYEHYKESWLEKVSKMHKPGEKESTCPTCKKRIPGATEEGWKNSMICHLAITHGELKTVMESDVRVTQKFIDELFSTNSKKPEKKVSNSTQPTIQIAAPAITPTPEPPKKPQSVNKEKKKRTPSPEIFKENSEYIRKRKPINLTEEDLIDDEMSDAEEELEKMVKIDANQKRELPKRSAVKRKSYLDNDFIY